MNPTTKMHPKMIVKSNQSWIGSLDGEVVVNPVVVVDEIVVVVVAVVVASASSANDIN